MRPRLAAVAMAVVVLVAACGPGGRPGGPAAVERASTTPAAGGGTVLSTLSVFAAASLTEVFTELQPLYERAHPDARVRYSFAGTQQLVTQIQQGAPADVFASADDASMQKLSEDNLVATPRPFARNRLVVIVPAAGSAVQSVQDLASPGVKLDLADSTVPAGSYARQMLDKLSRDGAYGPNFKARVLGRVVSNEDNVKTVVTKVSLGEADAGVCYATDITPAVQARVRVIDVPDAFNVIAPYPVAITTGTTHRGLADAFVQLLLSPEGQAVLRAHHFLPAEGSPPAARVALRMPIGARW